LEENIISQIFLKNNLNVETTWEEILELIDQQNQFLFAPKKVL
jgi:hypothetical protein